MCVLRAAPLSINISGWKHPSARQLGGEVPGMRLPPLWSTAQPGTDPGHVHQQEEELTLWQAASEDSLGPRGVSTPALQLET